MRTFFGIMLLSILLSGNSFASEKGLTVKGIRYFSYPTFTRIVFEAEAAAPYVLTKDENTGTLHFSAYDRSLVVNVPQIPAINDGVVKKLEDRKEDSHRVIVVHLDSGAGEAKDFVLRNPDRIVLDITRRDSTPAPDPVPSAKKGLVIMLDPGHGGKDGGLAFSRGQEKALTLEIAQTLRKLAKKSNPQMTVLFTREKDQGLTLDDRAALANASGAILFLSIHLGAGSSQRVFVHEMESGAAPRVLSTPKDFIGIDMETARLETVWGRQQAMHVRESYQLARKLLAQQTGKNGNEPVQAPVALLRSIDVPAVLVEAGVESDRARVAEDLMKGIVQYVREQR